jgi:hypothetical protein
LKVFTWNSSGRAQARNGFNDDLVMSLAIGTWLYDASGDFTKSNEGLNNAMLEAMSKNQRTYSETPGQALTPMGVYANSSPNRSSDRNNVKQDLINTKNRSMIPQDFMWVIK